MGIIDGLYLLNGVSLPRPNTFSREFISVSNDTESIDGRRGRDLRMVKEKFILHWQNLHASEFTIIKDIVELNKSVTFSVSDANLTINEINVIVYMGSIEYNTPGSTYIGDMEIELIQEE
jgi:hypothetical protein